MRPGSRHNTRQAWVDDVLTQVADIIGKDEAVQDLITQAEVIAQNVHRDVTTSQLRNIFGPVRKIQLEWRENPTQSFRAVMLLRPKLAYQAKRANKQGFYDLAKVLDKAIAEIGKTAATEERYARFRRFVDFFEAILAYHKSHGGK